MTLRQRIRVYIQDVWNKCDLTAIILFIVGLICRHDCTKNIFIIYHYIIIILQEKKGFSTKQTKRAFMFCTNAFPCPSVILRNVDCVASVCVSS